MASFGLEVTGVSLSVLGWVLSIISCALPMWKVSAFIGANIVTAQVFWQGLWMNCVFQSTGQMQCKVYDSMLALPQDLQAARALTIVSIIVGLVALLISMVGAKCTNCIEDEGVKARVMISSGAAFIAAALAELIPVSWSANTIVVEFYSPLIPTGQKMEIGAALYLGWAAAALLMVGGCILCCSCPPREEKTLQYNMPNRSRMAYSAAPSGIKDLWFLRQHLIATPHPAAGSLIREGADMSMGMEIVGIALGVIGFIITIVSTALPMWRVTAFIGANIITAQVIWEGLWMNCVTQSTGQMQCKVYDSLLALTPELQASRAMMVIAIILGVLGVMISIVGAKCTNCIEEEGAKAKVMIIAGIFFILGGVLVLIPVSWTAHVVIRDFYNPILSNPQRRELGAALYIGWAAAALLLIGGAMLCSSCPPKEEKYKPPRMAYSTPRSASAGGVYDRKDYV
ncbi:Claudin-3 Clostridium perfringens enterotoxin receptor 2 [Takifugu flavidus]|uniref:Claudin-3 Clostridium perfringens enterotoxin receptor 2 n=2 Tax=Takifugu flavidus TaxID=433684 RepID=A0A5C6P5I6_9TELE|nr:Claudin-3 Clostridium perfringens enterotoxin receptor 2 [Takifugu flavidus]